MSPPTLLYPCWHTSFFHLMPPDFSFSFPFLSSFPSLPLKHGSNLTGMTDLNVPEQLYQYMVGGHRRAQAGANRERHKSPSYQIKVDEQVFSSFHPLKIMHHCNKMTWCNCSVLCSLSILSFEPRTALQIRWYCHMCLWEYFADSWDFFKCDLWLFQEGDTINVDVTCPGATLALAMIYLKTNNRWKKTHWSTHRFKHNTKQQTIVYRCKLSDFLYFSYTDIKYLLFCTSIKHII